MARPAEDSANAVMELVCSHYSKEMLGAVIVRLPRLGALRAAPDEPMHIRERGALTSPDEIGGVVSGYEVEVPGESKGRGEHGVADHPVCSPHRSPPLRGIEKGAIKGACGAKHVGVLGSYLDRLETAEGEAIYGSATPEGDRPVMVVHVRYKLTEEIILEAACADACTILSEMRGAEVHKEAGHAVVVAADAWEDKYHRPDIPFREEVPIYFYSGRATP